MFGRLVAYDESWMGMTEFKPSLAPRRKIKSSFFPLRPMLPSASARFITNGMSTRVDNATPNPTLAEWSRKDRRERTLKECIRLLFLKTLKGHQHRQHAPDPSVV